MVSMNPDENDKIRVMLVDDSTIFLRAATFFLHQHPEIEVVGTLCSGDQAVALAQLFKPQIVLLDLSLPGLPGLQVIAELQAMLPEIRVIVLTLLDIEIFRRAAFDAGAAAFVSKVSARTDLLAAIRTTAQAKSNAVRANRAFDAGRFQDAQSAAQGENAYG